MDDPNTPVPPRSDSQQPTIYGLTISFTVLSCASVIARIYTRQNILHTLGADDVTIVIAQILSVGVAVTSCLQVALGGLGLHIVYVSPEAFLHGARGLYSNLLVYNAAQIFTKISFLIQYRRLFPDKNIRRICNGGMIFLAIWGVLQQFLTGFSCVPLELLMPKWRGRCIPTFAIWNLNSITNILTDFMIFLIPMAPVIKLQMSRKRRIYLLLVFCLGFFACAISIVRLRELYRTGDSDDATWDSSATTYWSSVELNVGILCACLPTIRPLLRKFAPSLFASSHDNTSSYKLGAMGSKISARRTQAPDGIYVQKDVEFQSTTQLRSPMATLKNPFETREASLEDHVIHEGHHRTRHTNT